MSEDPFFSLPNPGQVARAIEFLETSKLDFVSNARAIGLDPGTDFRFGNFDQVDFGDCDLRNVDFTGASLRGATRNVNTKHDLTTILDGADVEGSFFDDEKELVSDPAREQSYLKAHWSDQVIWLDRFQFGASSPTGEDSARILNTFLCSDDAFVRRTALAALRMTVGTDDLLSLIERVVLNSGDRSLLEPSLELLQELFEQEPQRVKRMLLSQLNGAWAAEAAIFLTEMLEPRQLLYLSELISRNKSSVVRRRFISALARRQGLAILEVARNPETGDVYDFDSFIPEVALDVQTKAILRRRKRSLFESPDSATDIAIANRYFGKEASVRRNVQSDMAVFSKRYGLGWHFMEKNGFYADYSFIGEFVTEPEETLSLAEQTHKQP